MAAEDRIAVGSTPESLWRGWAGLDALPRLQIGELRRAGLTRAVVVAAHPDDEVLGAGGAMALLDANGVQVSLVSVTDGEGSHPESVATTPARMAAVRARELAAALATLRLEQVPVTRLGLPDSGVQAHEPELTDRLRAELAGADLVLCPWRGDAHPDHEAAGRAARASAPAAACVLEYPVWLWHWSAPADPRVQWASAVRLDLGAEVAARKAAAIACFVSQVQPIGDAPADAAIVPPGVVAHFERGFEVFLR